LLLVVCFGGCYLVVELFDVEDVNVVEALLAFVVEMGKLGADLGGSLI
jgi:hypothetical protein